MMKRFLFVTVVVMSMISFGAQSNAEVEPDGHGMPEIKSHADYK
ncbi:hypothetical protein NSQ26_14110 [Bacillus sp. FSL W7-1360]